MKLVVLIPSSDYLGNAGARIRYARIREECTALGSSVTLMPIDEFEAGVTPCTAILISKCHDARAVVSAIRAREHGILVGVDLFDDYFSQTRDSRMARYRNWLAQLAPHLSFALASTETMANVVRSYRADLPVHVMNDPSPPVDPARMAEILHDKQQAFRDRQTLEICWFGMGTNPHFPVGIHDLAAFGGALEGIVRHGISPRVTILTNAHGLRANDLAALQQLPAPVKVEPWSEAREAEVLERAHVAFIPVNAQSFSVAKSLNRAWTALVAGCQVLSAGFPLYEALMPMIYRNVDALLTDLAEDQAKLRPQTIAQLAALNDAVGSAAQEAARLRDFLVSLAADRSLTSGGLLALVHGASTSGAVHKFAQRHAALTIRSPFCPAELGYDIVFWGRHPGAPLHILVGERARTLAEQRGCYVLVPAGRIAGRPVWSLPDCPPVEELPGNWSGVPVAAQIVAYPSVLRAIQQTLAALFGSIELVTAENSAWPFALHARAQT
ncbi:hypothetical protein [Novosphingobium aerophilum]|uniref:Glycosyltransferase n=1 Tax=Novosphingobium aerophilum TaxID=2839843 RepID=A0A7X1F6Y5_9SPHN|nr:hypothetical protein [Novosphingobium aerophilum]MBC2651535.1 hypothetical protein [Novosphingobium aerophilum]